MIGHCWFERVSAAGVVSETVRPWEDYGLYLVEYDDVPPRVRTYRATIEGRDGTLDLTEWEGAGIVRYNDRTVKIKMRDLIGKSKEFISKMLGGRFNIYFSDNMEHYYVGRCDSIEDQTRRHVSTFTMTFTCKPFRFETRCTTATITVGVVESGSTFKRVEGDLIAVHASVPQIVISGVDSTIEPYSDPAARARLFWYIGKKTTPYYILEDGALDTSMLSFTSGANHYSLWNHSPNQEVTAVVTWHEGVI